MVDIGWFVRIARIFFVFFLKKNLHSSKIIVNFASVKQRRLRPPNENDLSAIGMKCVAAFISVVEFFKPMNMKDFLLWLIFGDRKRTVLFTLAAVFDYLTFVALW